MSSLWIDGAHIESATNTRAPVDVMCAVISFYDAQTYLLSHDKREQGGNMSSSSRT